MTKRQTGQPASLAVRIAARRSVKRLPAWPLQRVTITGARWLQSWRTARRRQRLRTGWPVQRRAVTALNHRHFGQARQTQYLVPPARLRTSRPEAADDTADDLFLAGQASGQTALDPAMDEGTTEAWAETPAWPPVSMAELREILATRDQTAPPSRLPSPSVQRAEQPIVQPAPVQPLPRRSPPRVKPISRIEEISARQSLPPPCQPEPGLPKPADEAETAESFELAETFPEAPPRSTVELSETEVEENSAPLQRQPESVAPATVESLPSESIRSEPETMAQTKDPQPIRVKVEPPKDKAVQVPSVQTKASRIAPQLKPVVAPDVEISGPGVNAERKPPKPKAILASPKQGSQPPTRSESRSVQAKTDSPASPEVRAIPLQQSEPAEHGLQPPPAEFGLLTQTAFALLTEESPVSQSEPDLPVETAVSIVPKAAAESAAEPPAPVKAHPTQPSRTRLAPKIAPSEPTDRSPVPPSQRTLEITRSGATDWSRAVSLQRTSETSPSESIGRSVALPTIPGSAGAPIPDEMQPSAQSEALPPLALVTLPGSAIDESFGKTAPPIQPRPEMPTTPNRHPLKASLPKAQPRLKRQVLPQKTDQAVQRQPVVNSISVESELPSRTVTPSAPLIAREAGSAGPVITRATASPQVGPSLSAIQRTAEPAPVQGQTLPPATLLESTTVARQVDPAEAEAVTPPAEEADPAKAFDLDHLARQIVPLIKRRLMIERQQVSRW